MDQMLDIPRGRKKIRVGRICLLLGMTVLLFLMITSQFGGFSGPGQPVAQTEIQ